MASAALLTAMVLGFQETFRPRDPVAIVVQHAGDPPALEPVTLFFHPTIPEATLVLVQ